MASDEEYGFRLIAEYSADIICRIGNDMKMLYVSPSCERVLGWTPEEMMNMPPFAHVVPEDLPALAAAAQRNLVPGVKPEISVARVRRKDGSIVWLEVNPNPVADPVTGQPTETIMLMRDITARKLLEQKLEEMALTDGLTLLANRHAFDANLDREWRNSIRTGAALSLLLIDIDYFKYFNDEYGHLAGDGCLRSVASAVRSCVRATDTTARFGGDELAVILPCTDPEGAMAVADKVHNAVRELEIAFDGRPDGIGAVTVTIGAATEIPRLLGLAPVPEVLLQAADSALYKAKHDGRNRIGSSEMA